jgi:nicotinamide phosphoribosyltransferase
MNNIILNSDSYKYSQWVQYPPKTEGVFSYVEARGGKYEQSVFFGLQAFIKEYLTQPITQENIDEAEELILAHGEPFNREGWEYILNEHGGRLPVAIRALPEGTVIDVSNALMTIENTDPKCYWLTSFLETALLRAIWYGTTVATNSFESKKVIHEALVKSGTPADIDFKLHDFGARGVSSEESAGIGGAAHLVNFLGTDNISALLTARRYYGEPVAGFSIPAMEHSTVTSWGKENEVESFRNMLKNFAKPGTILAAVSDSYDIYNACSKLWGEELRQEVIDSGAIVVIRPDSGDPATVVSKCLKLLDKKFGSTINEKGFKVLNNVRIIQGDGITTESISSILFNAVDLHRFSADNIAFGQGGALLQGLDRDTMQFAMKCSAIKIDGEWQDVYKQPATDSGKNSKRGRLAVVGDGEGFRTELERTGWSDDRLEQHNALELVYRNGELVRDELLGDIRERANAPFLAVLEPCIAA